MFSPTISSHAAWFGDDAAFLAKHTDLIVLSNKSGLSRIALAPAWQGRVMTSTAEGDAGRSFGWINRELIASGERQPHIHVFGGEDRFWLGPEGGQFSIFFAKGARFELSDWFTPPAIDTMRYEVVKQSKASVRFAAQFAVTNFRGTRFEVGVQREVRLLEPDRAWKALGLRPASDLKLVAYESENRITNKGKDPWRKETGLLSIWILGMFNHTPETTVVAPIRSGPESQFGPPVTLDYFGSIPPERLAIRNNVVYFSGDGQYRSKIGISPKRSKGVIGSYDAQNRVLTLVQFTQPKGVTDYVNSLWKLQENPYRGDAANSYNDGPPAPGAKPFGPFYELESSSPAGALNPGKRLSHVHRTIHLVGPENALDPVTRAVLDCSVAEIKSALKK